MYYTHSHQREGERESTQYAQEPSLSTESPYLVTLGAVILDAGHLRTDYLTPLCSKPTTTAPAVMSPTTSSTANSSARFRDPLTALLQTYTKCIQCRARDTKCIVTDDNERKW